MIVPATGKQWEMHVVSSSQDVKGFLLRSCLFCWRRCFHKESHIRYVAKKYGIEHHLGLTYSTLTLWIFRSYQLNPLTLCPCTGFRPKFPSPSALGFLQHLSGSKFLLHFQGLKGTFLHRAALPKVMAMTWFLVGRAFRHPRLQIVGSLGVGKIET